MNGSGPYVEATMRDMKAFIPQKNYCSIPIGNVANALQGSTARIDDVSQGAWEYLKFGVSNDKFKFFGVNMVTFCRKKPTPGMRLLRESFQNYPYQRS